MDLGTCSITAGISMKGNFIMENPVGMAYCMRSLERAMAGRKVSEERVILINLLRYVGKLVRETSVEVKQSDC